MLRCIGVLLVVFRHSGGSNLVQQSGWIGVDLFFVLSGFLISGLLFTEYKERGAIDVKRFYIRRALKLYPSFYLLMVVTVVMNWRLGHLRAAQVYLGELFYVQNYGPYVWSHTWSLAVEEHFYLILPIVLLGLVAFSRNKDNPFKAVPWVCWPFARVSCGSHLAGRRDPPGPHT